MSLVVARASLFGLQVFADSRVMDPAIRTPNPAAGTLKVVVIDPLLCVGFAGRVDVAHAVVRDLLRGSVRGRSLENARDKLLAAHLDSGRATDFLLGSLHETPRLFRVADSRIEEGSSFWVGSQPAFDFYQRQFHSAEPGDLEMHPPARRPWVADLRRMQHAWLELQRLDPFEDVGDFLIHVASNLRDGLGFNYTFRTSSTPPHARTSSTEWETLPMGTARDGGYTYSVLRPSRAGTPLVGIYLDQGHFGIVLSPTLEPDVVLIEDVTGPEFVDAVEARFGVRLEGILVAPDPVSASS